MVSGLTPSINGSIPTFLWWGNRRWLKEAGQERTGTLRWEVEFPTRRVLMTPASSCGAKPFSCFPGFEMPWWRLGPWLRFRRCTRRLFSLHGLMLCPHFCEIIVELKLDDSPHCFVVFPIHQEPCCSQTQTWKASSLMTSFFPFHCTQSLLSGCSDSQRFHFSVFPLKLSAC